MEVLEWSGRDVRKELWRCLNGAVEVLGWNSGGVSKELWRC